VNKFKKRWNDFKIDGIKLIYTPLNLEVVHNNHKEEKLKELYNDMKVGAGMGISSLYQKVVQHYLNIRRAEVEEFIKRQYPYQLTQNPRKTINKPLFGEFPNERWAADLIDINYYAGYNRQRKYILTVIDFFSKYVFAVGLVNKEAGTIIKAFEEIARRQSKGIYPHILQTDLGGEFHNDLFQQWCKAHDIRLVHNKTYSPTGNALVENFNKFLRKMMTEGFVRTNSLKWVDYLDDYLYNRNHTKHAVTKFPPASAWTPTRGAIKPSRNVKSILSPDAKLNTNEVKSKVLKTVVEGVKAKLEKYKDEELHVGDKVRFLLSAIDNTMRKAIKSGDGKKIVVKFSPAVFEIKRIVYAGQELRKQKYYLNDANIKQSFYYNELQKVDDTARTIPITPSKLNKFN
jgi:transposase InsO family protein